MKAKYTGGICEFEVYNKKEPRRANNLLGRR